MVVQMFGENLSIKIYYFKNYLREKIRKCSKFQELVPNPFFFKQ